MSKSKPPKVALGRPPIGSEPKRRVLVSVDARVHEEALYYSKRLGIPISHIFEQALQGFNAYHSQD